MGSANLLSFNLQGPSSRRRRPSDHRGAPRCHGGVNDEENRKDIVEANLTVLRARMEELREKERRIPIPIPIRRRSGQEIDNGWRYNLSMNDGAKGDGGFDCKKLALISGCLDLVITVGGAVGLVFVGGSLSICLVSLLVRHFL